MDIASGQHWSKPSDFKGGAEGNLLSQAWLVLPSSCPCDSEPSLAHGQCPDHPARCNQRCSSTSLSPSSCSCNSDCSYLKTAWSSLKLKESNKDIEVLPLRVNRIDALLKKNKKLVWEKRGLRLVIHQTSDKHLWLDQMENPLWSPKSSGQMVLLRSWNTGAKIHPSLSYWIYQASWLVSLSTFNQPSPTPAKIKVLYFSLLWLIRKVIIKISFMVQCLAWGWPQIWVV